MTYKFDLNGPQYTAIYYAWKLDHDDEGYNFPFIDMWSRYRLNGDIFIQHVGSDSPAYIVFEDEVAAVEFKLKWL